MLLGAPLSHFLLQAVSEQPKRQAELHKEAGFPAQTTLRVQLKHLVELGALTKRRRDRFPGALEYELSDSGRGLLGVARILECWLDRASSGPLTPGGNTAKAAIKALAEGWSTTMLRALAAGPLSLTELDSLISSFSYPALERRLGAMHRAGLVARRQSSGRSTPYGVTGWACEAVAPLAAAANWEQRHLPELVAPIAGLDVEAAFLLAVPLLQPGAGLSGSCRMAVELANDRRRRLAGVTLRLEHGVIASCATRLAPDGADAWVSGPPMAWLATLIEGEADRLELGGDRHLASCLIGKLQVKQLGVPM